MQEKITEELMEQTYLFCYKRLGNPEDARDLAQDILCEALQGIASGRKIYQFQSWYWRLARNRYSVMVNRRNHAPTECPIEEYQDRLWSISDSVADQMVLAEDLSKMHVAISRLSRLHREILVQYYIKEQPVSVIAKKLEIPEGTVKRRLFDARHQVKERMEQMPKVTELSYAPSELELWMSQGIIGVQVFQDLLGKQILACCYSQAKSAGELSEQIQVAPIYLEDKLAAMEQAGVVKKAGKGKYLTSFLIFSKNKVTEMLRSLDPVYMEISERLYGAIKENWDSVLEVGFYGADLPSSYLNYSILTMGMGCFGERCVQAYHESPLCRGFGPVQTDNFNYCSTRIMGQVMPAEERPVDYQVKALQWRPNSKRIDTVGGQIFLALDAFCSAPFSEERIHRIHGYNVELLYELALNPHKELSEKERMMVSGLLQQRLVQKRGRGYFPEIVILEREQAQQINRLFHRLLQPLAEKYFSKISQTVNQYLLPLVRKDLLEQYYNYVMEIFLCPTSSMLWWCKENGALGELGDAEYSMAGVVLQHNPVFSLLEAE